MENCIFDLIFIYNSGTKIMKAFNALPYTPTHIALQVKCNHITVRCERIYAFAQATYNEEKKQCFQLFHDYIMVANFRSHHRYVLHEIYSFTEQAPNNFAWFEIFIRQKNIESTAWRNLSTTPINDSLSKKKKQNCYRKVVDLFRQIKCIFTV